MLSRYPCDCLTDAVKKNPLIPLTCPTALFERSNVFCVAVMLQEFSLGNHDSVSGVISSDVQNLYP